MTVLKIIGKIRGETLMAGLSVLLHVFFLGTIMVVSTATPKKPEIKEIKVPNIRLASAPVALKTEKLNKPKKEPDLDKLFKNMANNRPRPAPMLKVPETAKTGSLEKDKNRKVKIKPTKKPKKPGTTPKDKSSKPKKNKLKRDKPKKDNSKIQRAKIKEKPKIDPEKLLAKRLKELREKVDERKKQQDQAWENRATAGAAQMDQETVAWFREVRNRINSNWSVIDENLSGHRTTIVGVTMSANGALISATIDSPSGDKALDNSALRAVFQAAPFPELPEKLRKKIESSGGLALRFSPQGVM